MIKNFINKIGILLSFQNTSALLKRNKKNLFTGLFLILLFNIFLYTYTENHSLLSRQYRKYTSGFSHTYAQKFFYFYYYTGYFPLATLNDSLTYSKQAAYKEINKNGKDLIMEYKHWSRLGENLRIIAYYPNALLKGSPEKPSIKLFNALIFVLGLMAVFWAFWDINKTIIGACLVFVTNLTPFFIYEIYQNQNIFGLMASVFLIVLAINLKFIFNKKTPVIQSLVLAVLSGIIVALSSEIRGETSVIIISIILMYLISKSFKYYVKILALVILISGFLFTKKIVKNYFDNNFKKTYELVKEKGGHPYDGYRISGHRFWHPVFCGLGDFDTKYGYVWHDTVAYHYAIPVLQEKYGLNLKYSGTYHLDEYYDKDKIYYKKFDDFDEYEEIVKEKVLHDIKSDPLWYLTILTKRFSRILYNTVPFDYLGWLAILLILILYKTKQYELIMLIFISLPLSITSFVIYSGGNSTYNSFFPEISLAILFAIIAEYILSNTKLIIR